MFKYNLILKYKHYTVVAILFMLLVLSRYVILKYDLSGSARCAGVYPAAASGSVVYRASYETHMPFRPRHPQTDMSSC